jgi:hypothetical protein
MNYGEYMRKQAKNSEKIIINKSGLDASDVILRNQALATTITPQTYFSSIDASSGKTAAPIPFVTSVTTSGPNLKQNTDSQLPSIARGTTSLVGYIGAASGANTVDRTNSLIQSAQFAAMSNINGSVGFTRPIISTIIPCSLSTIVTAQISTLGITPGEAQILRSSGPGFPSPGIIFSDPSELIRNQASNASIRTRYNLPSKLSGLRGPIVNSR